VQQSASSIVVNLDIGLTADRHGLSSAATEMHEASLSLMRGLAVLNPERRVCSAVVVPTNKTKRKTDDLCCHMIPNEA